MACPKRRKELREYTSAIKLDKGCEFCGYNDHSHALHFDHIDPKTKTMDVGALVSGTYSMKKIDAEIAKCRVLCANCHAIHTFEPEYFESDKKQLTLELA